MSSQFHFRFSLFYTSAALLLVYTTVSQSSGISHVQQGNWTFLVNLSDGNTKVFERHYAKTIYSNCLYYATDEFLLCDGVQSFQDVISKLTSNQESIRYVSVSCFHSKSKVQTERFCVCQRKNSSSSKPCQLTRLTSQPFQGYSSLEVLDVSNNLISVIHPRSFENLPSLTAISLSHNPLSPFSTQPVCFPAQLQILDLSYSQLKDIPRFSLCRETNDTNLPVIYLDISHAHLREIPSDSLANFGNLQFMNLSDNFISRLPLTPFNVSVNLTWVDLSFNHIETITNTVCNDASKLKQISFASNKISSLDFNFFTECAALESLDLSDNRIGQISGIPLTFGYLKLLNLSGNSLSNLTDTMFSNTSEVGIADLSHNNIKFISEQVFDHGGLLESLILRDNLLNESQLEEMTRNSRNLRHLDMSLNMVTSLHFSFLSHLGLLEHLDLSNNQILTVHLDAFVGLRSLKYLNVANNFIGHFDFSSISGLSVLIFFNISHNNLNHVIMDPLPPSILLVDVSRNNLTSLTPINSSTLQHFSVSRNSIDGISRNDFAGCSNLTSVDFSHNLLVDFDPFAFQNSPSIEMLDISHNQIASFPNKTLTPLRHLQKLDISHNLIRLLSQIQIPEDLLTLDVSHNQLISLTQPVIASNSSAHKLQELDMRGCDITSAARDAFTHLNFLRTVNLRNNNMATFPRFIDQPETQFDMRGNPLECTCSMTWLKKLVTETVKHKEDLKYLVDFCAVPPNYQVMSFLKVVKEAFLCQTYDKCPDLCSCFTEEKKKSPEFIMCGKRNLTSVPPNITSYAKVIALDGNNFQELKSISKFDLSVQELYLNSSNISKLHDQTFFNMPMLKLLDLSGNHLTYIQKSLFSQLRNLTVLNISNNQINNLQDFFGGLSNLQTLDLSNNELVYASENFFLSTKRQHNIQKVYLAGNPWSCDCQNENLIKWIQRHRDEYHARTHRARTGTDVAQGKTDILHNQHQDSIIQDYMSIFCDEQSQMVDLDLAELDCDGENFRKKISILVACIVSFIISCLIFFCIYHRKLITAVMYSRFNCVFLKQVPTFNEQLLLSAPFDITVIYDFSDRKLQWWVDSILMPKLHQPKWRFSVKYPQKDDTEKSLSVVDMSIHSVNRSRCSLVVATSSFGSNRQSVSCFQQALKQRRKCLHTVVIVTWGELTRDTLETGIRSFVNKGLNLPITSRFFWDKLFYQLPLPRHRSSRPRPYDNLVRRLRSQTSKDNASATENNVTKAKSDAC